MNKLVKLVDVLNNEILYQGKGSCQHLKNGGLQFSFGTNDHLYLYKVWEKGCIIESKQECTVVLSLRKGAETSGHIYSPFGQMDVRCQTIDYVVNQHCVEVKYVLLQPQECQVFHFKLNITDEEELYAIH